MLFLEPLFKLLYLKVNSGFSFNRIISSFYSSTNFISFFAYWALIPLCGLLIYKTRIYTFFLAVLIHLYFLVHLLIWTPYTWPYYSSTLPQIVWFTLIINIISLSILLLRNNKKLYFHPNLRWYENATRYLVPKKDLNNESGITILNISSSGILFKSLKKLQVGDSFSLENPIDSKNIKTLVIREATQGVYGACFSNISYLKKLYYEIKLIYLNLSKEVQKQERS